MATKKLKEIKPGSKLVYHSRMTTHDVEIQGVTFKLVPLTIDILRVLQSKAKLDGNIVDELGAAVDLVRFALKGIEGLYGEDEQEVVIPFHKEKIGFREIDVVNREWLETGFTMDIIRQLSPEILQLSGLTEEEKEAVDFTTASTPLA